MTPHFQTAYKFFLEFLKKIKLTRLVSWVKLEANLTRVSYL